MPEVGELVVGAYLQLVRNCRFVLYNQRPEGGGIEGLGELDVVGIADDAVYVCEVTTHILGMDVPSARRIAKKFQRQKKYASGHFKDHEKVFEIWSPVIASGPLAILRALPGLRIVCNEDYARRIAVLQNRARTMSSQTGNDAFRLMQILARLRDKPRCSCGHDIDVHGARGCSIRIAEDFSGSGKGILCQCSQRPEGLLRGLKD